jgi:hypothetical protein
MITEPYLMAWLLGAPLGLALIDLAMTLSQHRRKR